ncbi:MAG TPA: hypothetical protein VNS62_09410 [Candidatus Udaeobacter sp.]|nr:hypothetical protein [Candidatus Udaeobacter sp.]
MKLPNPCTQGKLAEARDLPPQNAPFAAINVAFHETYTRLVEQVLAELGESVPVVVVIGDDATLLCDGREQREQVIPARYHELKALAHLAFGVQLTLMANGSGRLTELTANELHEKRAQIREAQAAVNTASSVAPKAPAELLCRARTLVDRVLDEGVVDFDRLHEHVRALASHALETAQLAVCIELEQLHALLGRWRNDLGERRWAGLYVVICGAHQPRYREATCQYFGQLLHQPDGYGAEREDRLVYGEGLCDVNTALDLLARHIVDQRASNLLFGDRRRLQEDLLADAANTEVRKLFPKVHGCPRGAQRRRAH